MAAMGRGGGGLAAGEVVSVRGLRGEAARPGLVFGRPEVGAKVGHQQDSKGIHGRAHKNPIAAGQELLKRGGR